MNSKYWILSLAGLLIWLYGSYTGSFQVEAQSNFEYYTDMIGQLLMGWGIIGDISKGVVIQKNVHFDVQEKDLLQWVKKYE